jgi:hypothetical protein
MNILIDKLSAEIPNWRKVISSIEREDSSGSRSLRDGEREVFNELKEFWKYNDFNPNRAKDLINELKKHEPYHAPKWDELGEFRRVCVQYYTKDKNSFDAFQQQLGGKNSRDNILSNSDDDFSWFQESLSNADFDAESWNEDTLLFREDEDIPKEINGQIKILSLLELTNLILERHEYCDYTFFQRTGYDKKFVKHEEWWKKNTEYYYPSCLENYQLEGTFMHRSWFNGMSGMMLLKSNAQPIHHLIILVHDKSEGRNFRLINPYEKSILNINQYFNNSKLLVCSINDNDFIKNNLNNGFFPIHEKIKKVLLNTIYLINN